MDRTVGREGRQERGLWVAAAVWLLIIYSTLYYVRGPIEKLREKGLLHLAVAAVFLLAAVTVTFFLARSGAGWRGMAVLGGSALVYFVAITRVDQPEEKLHFLEYGVLAGLIYGALLARRQRLLAERDREPCGEWVQALGAVLATTALGWGDEGLQAILPNRYYDLRDVMLNFAAAMLAVAAMSAWIWSVRKARQSDV